MPRFLSEIKFSREAMQGLIDEPQDRATSIAPVMESLGGRLVDYYFSVGNGIAFVIYDLPDVDALQAVSMRVLGDGVISEYRTHRVLTSAEAVEGMKKAAAISYSTPTS